MNNTTYYFQYTFDNNKNIKKEYGSFNNSFYTYDNARGEYDGFIWDRLEDIYRIEYGDDYKLKIFKLYILIKQNHPTIKINQDNILFSLLEFAIQNNLLVTQEMGNDSVIGYVESYCDYITLNVVDFYRNNKGKSIVSINDINVITCDSDEKQDLKLLDLTHEN